MIKKFFLRRFRHYLVAFLLPSLIVLLFLFGLISTTKLHEMQTESRRSLDNMSDTFSLITENAFRQQDMMTLNPQMMLSLRKILLFSTTNYTDYVFLNSMNALLSATARSSPFIRSLYLYLRPYDSFFTSSNGIQNLQSYYDTSWYDIYCQLPAHTKQTIVRRRIPASSSAEEFEALTIFHRLSYLDGYLVANIPVETFLSSLTSTIPVWDNHMYILNQEHEVLLTTETNARRLESCRSWFSRQSGTEELSSGSLCFVNGSIFMTMLQKNDAYGLSLLILIPLHSILLQIAQELLWPLILILFNLLLVVVLAYTTTRTNFRQINYVIKIFGDAEKGIYPDMHPDTQPLTNEYDLIMNNILRLFLNTTFLNSQLKEQKYKKQASELAALQLQINPHFMVNTLQTLDFEVYKLTDQPTAAHQIICHLSDILQYSLGSPNTPVTIADEIANVRKYVEIQKYRFPDCFHVYFDVDDAVLDLPFRRLILQPLVENSISHGIRCTDHFGYIRIRIFQRKGWIHVSVTDTGAGLSRERLEQLRSNLSAGKNGTSIGLDNVNKRLMLTYGEDSGLQLLSHEGLGTTVRFRIPLP